MRFLTVYSIEDAVSGYVLNQTSSKSGLRKVAHNVLDRYGDRRESSQVRRRMGEERGQQMVVSSLVLDAMIAMLLICRAGAVR